MAWNYRDEIQFGGENVTELCIYVTHFCLAVEVETSFYSDMVDCLSVDPVSLV